MGNVIKAKVIRGRYLGETVRITNISINENGKENAACFLSDGSRANIPVADLEIIPVKIEEPTIRRAQTASMPFISGSTGSRTMTHTKNMARPKIEKKSYIPPRKIQMAICESCGTQYNLEERKGKAGKLTDCDQCAIETESLMEGTMVFSHKTGATIEIKKDGELKHEAPTFDPKNKI